MKKITNTVLSRVAQKTGGNVPAIYVEKASISPNGHYAKALFRLGTAKDIARSIVRDRGALAAAFDHKFEGAARLVVASVHATEHDDLYCGFIKLNSAQMSMDTASTKNFREITANMFIDPEDNIWNVQEAADGKVLIRTSEDNLQTLLNTKATPPNLHVAANAYDLNGAVVGGQIVSFFDHVKEELRKGITVDNCSVFDLKTHKVVETANCDFAAASPIMREWASQLNTIFNDPNKKYTELAASGKSAVVRYMTALYSQNKQFLDAYLDKIDELLTV